MFIIYIQKSNTPAMHGQGCGIQDTLLRLCRQQTWEYHLRALKTCTYFDSAIEHLKINPKEIIRDAYENKNLKQLTFFIKHVEGSGLSNPLASFHFILTLLWGQGTL